MNILVIDGQGGRLGKGMVSQLREKFPKVHIMAVGTNSTAASTMLKAGADEAASGENPVVCACRKADIIVGPVAMVIADALLGEVTAKMAAAVARAEAVRIMIPMNRCDNLVAGIGNEPAGELIDDAVKKIEEILSGECRK